jgi:hypothetical protein
MQPAKPAKEKAIHKHCGDEQKKYVAKVIRESVLSRSFDSEPS